MRWMLRWLAAFLLIPIARAGAQQATGSIRVGISIGSSSFSGATETIEARSDNLRAMPYLPTMWGITLSYGATGLRGGIAVAYGQPVLSLRGNPGATPDESGNALRIIADNAFKLSAFSASLSVPIKRFPAGPSLRPSLGVLLERWASPGAPTQTIAGAQAGLALEIPLTKSLSVTLSADAGFTPGSPFLDEIVPEGFRTRSTWRRTLAGGVVVKL